MNKESCGTCRFFLNGSIYSGYCRRYPDMLGVDKKQWCGEWGMTDAAAKKYDEYDTYAMKVLSGEIALDVKVLTKLKDLAKKREKDKSDAAG